MVKSKISEEEGEEATVDLRSNKEDLGLMINSIFSEKQDIHLDTG